MASSEVLHLLAERLVMLLGEDAVLQDEPMAAHTTFRVGGPADIFVMPRDADAVAAALEACAAAHVPYFVLGCGSDLLVSDEGYRGVIVSLTEGLDELLVEGNLLVCGAGATLADSSELAAACGLTGLEFSCGIPGSVGGACFMNAGAYDGCIADVLECVEVLNPVTLQRMTLGVDELDLGYRHSRIADEGLVVLSARFALAPADISEIRAKMDDLTAQRKAKQPLELPSAGSTFKRPEGYFAGKLITDAGLKGYQVGGAAVSKKHAGFVVNLGQATAADIHAVIEHVQDEVERQFGVRLQPEVRFL